MSPDANVDGFHAALRKRCAAALRRLRARTNCILAVIANRLDTRRVQIWIKGQRKKTRASNDKMGVTASTSKDMTAEVPTLNEENTNEEEQKDYDEGQEKFVLPPEYDKDDSRWTLKYREFAPGLAELVEHSGVYVNADKLAECNRLPKDWNGGNFAARKNWSKDCKRLARMLLTEIFTTSALSTCSWTGATATDIDVGHARPGLDENARNTLLMFLVSYGQVRDWYSTDYQCILKMIRQIMLDMRRNKEIGEDEEKDDGEPLKETEYDADDSRCTLKYREPAPGLVELIEHSGVYVNAEKLAECKKMSHDCKTLAYMLRDEIFTTSALSTCSMAEATANNSKNSGTIIWPGLDEHALIILLTYVAESTWLLNSEQSMRYIIRQKLELKRRVDRKNKEEEDDNEIVKINCCFNLKNLF